MKYTFFDLESTDLDVKHGRIIEIGIIETNEKLEPTNRVSLKINPNGVFVSEEAEKVHGISNEDLVDCPIFPEVWKTINQYFDGNHNIVTYNGNTFDIKLLFYECARYNFELKVSDKKIIDIFRLEKKINKMRLVDVFKNYTGKTMEDAGLAAHNALSDVEATLTVFKNQIQSHKLEVMDYMKSDTAMLSPLGSVIIKDGKPCISFGKHRGKPLEDLKKYEKGYVNWLIGNYCEETKDYELRKLLR